MTYFRHGKSSHSAWKVISIGVISSSYQLMLKCWQLVAKCRRRFSKKNRTGKTIASIVTPNTALLHQ